jgi:hypothetical protein
MRNLVERIRPLGSFQKCSGCRVRAATVFCFACEHFLCADCDEAEPLHRAPSASPDAIAGGGGGGGGAQSVGAAPSAASLAAVLSSSLNGSTDAQMQRSDSMPSLLRHSSDAGSATPAHVRVPVLDALAILQLRKADAELEAGTLSPQMIPPQLSREQCNELFHRWLGSSWLMRGSDAIRRSSVSLCFLPCWAWKVETLAAGSIQPLLTDVPHVDRNHNVAFTPHVAHCSLRTWRRPVIVCATSEVTGSVLSRLGDWAFDSVERLADAAPEHPTARNLAADIAQRDAWPEAERRVEQEATEELEKELRRRAGLERSTSTLSAKSDICVTSKTVRRLWLPVYIVRYTIAGDDQHEDEFVCYINGQSGRCFGERPAVSTSRILGVFGLGLGLVMAPLAAYRLARDGKL